MPYSYDTFTSKSSGDTITVSFPFLERGHIYVKVGETTVSTSLYSWVSDGVIECLDGFPSGAGEVRRVTPGDELPSGQKGAGTFDWRAANENDTALLYRQQELDDGEADRQAQVDEAVAKIDAVDQAVIDAGDAATAAALSASQANTAKTGAETAAGNADTAKTGAEDAATLAQRWASEEEDTPVAGSEYSAKHYAAKAAEERAGIISDATTVLGSGRIPVGFRVPWDGLKAPNQYWVFVDTVGQVFSRTLFPQLLDALAPEFDVSFSTGDPVVTGIDCPQDLSAGWAVEGDGIPAGTTILSVDSSSQITLSENPTDDGTVIRIFPHGNGDGSTTANYPALAGRVTRGLDRTGSLNPEAENVVGETQEDAMQRITGSHSTAFGTRVGIGVTVTEGAFDTEAGPSQGASGGDGQALKFNFDSGNSPGAKVSDEETRVKAIIAPYIIKVADGADDPAIISAASVVSDLAAAQADISALEAAVDALESESFGIGQAWSSPSRANNVWYENTTNRPIFIMVRAQGSSTSTLAISSDGVTAHTTFTNTVISGSNSWISAMLSPGEWYRTTNVNQWMEYA